MLWHVVCTPYVEAVKSALSGIVAVAGTMDDLVISKCDRIENGGIVQCTKTFR